MKADWGLRYEVMSDCMRTIKAVAESMSSELEGYGPEKGIELIYQLAGIYEDAVASYGWPEERIWKKWKGYQEWAKVMKDSLGVDLS